MNKLKLADDPEFQKEVSKNLSRTDGIIKTPMETWTQAEMMAMTIQAFYTFGVLRAAYKERYGEDIIIPDDIGKRELIHPAASSKLN